MIIYILAICIIYNALSLDNGVAITPPMGWSTWQNFRCQVDCTDHFHDCINDNLIRSMIDAMKANGLDKLGYNYINIGDCWSAHSRDGDGKIQPDNYRFTSGMESLATYAHDNGFKLGLLTSTNSKTCSGFMGSKGHYIDDAIQFAKWGIDSVKVDACDTPKAELEQSYVEISTALNKTGRPMLYSCSWGAYDGNANLRTVSKYCNTFRLYSDISNNWNSISSLIDNMGNGQSHYSIYVDNGQWLDPDSLIIGNTYVNNGGIINYQLTIEEYKTMFSLWSIWGSPLILTLDIRLMQDDILNIINNKDIIDINQDILAIPGRLYFKDSNYEIWGKPLYNGDWAVGIYNHNNVAFELDLDLHHIGIKINNIAVLYDLNKHTIIGQVKQGQLYHINEIPSHGTLMIRVKLNN